MGNSKNMSLGILDSINKKSNNINKDINNNVDNDIFNDVDGNVSDNVNKTDSINVSKDVSIGNDIIIKRNKKSEELKRVSYYLYPSIIKKIEKLAKNNDMGISEFLLKLLIETLDKIKVEE